MKKTIIVLLMVLLALNVFAAGGKSQGGSKQLAFTFVLPMVPNEIWVVAKEGFETRCKELGIKAIVVMPSTPNDVNQMNNLMETAIAEGVNGVVTQPVNPEGMAPAFAKLNQAGIPFALVNSDAPKSGRIVSVGTGGSVGRIAGDYIIKKMGNKPIRYITALWALEAGLAIDIHNNYTATFAKAPGGAGCVGPAHWLSGRPGVGAAGLRHHGAGRNHRHVRGERMNLLLDTHLLLWASARILPQAAVPFIGDPENTLFFSPVSIWETVIKRALNRPDFQIDPAALYHGLLERGYTELAVTSRHALAMGSLPAIHKDPFDRLLIAQARTEGISLLTADETVARYKDAIMYVQK
jgi:PIN domain nuclease of toxin-antitoxin system